MPNEELRTGPIALGHSCRFGLWLFVSALGGGKIWGLQRKVCVFGSVEVFTEAGTFYFGSVEGLREMETFVFSSVAGLAVAGRFLEGSIEGLMEAGAFVLATAKG